MSEKQLTGNQIRAMFLEFWREKGCMIEPSASLIPHDDPTLLWINAGVSTLKKYFDGTEKPANPRIANAQKCIRTNDIENVGRTARHHTFFEMLGNFSIGDYFKEEAIPWAWDFLTNPKWIGFDKSRMYVTVYPDDTEAYRIWTTKTDVNPAHICKNPDNFWEIGEGPGGPDSEIFYDRGEKYDPDHIGEKLFFEDMENDRYIEVWNIVFSQYNCQPDLLPRSEYKELPQKNIDTGMGLERLVALKQGGETNFDTDLFLPIIHETEKYTTHPYSDPEYKMAYRVIADHVRTVTFALADGAGFSNDGRGYVLRRVLRRAVRYGIKLEIKGSFMYRLVPTVADVMKDYYPYLQDKIELVQKQIRNEEETFASTLSNGEALLSQTLEENQETKQLSGEVIFKLYDTYGFPKELTKEIAEEKGYTCDMDGFEKAMNEQKERARAARSDEQSMGSQEKDLMDFTTPSTFTGYTDATCRGTVIGLFKDGVKVEELSEEGDVILDQTCFYAESGGQIADAGRLWNEQVEAEVTDVQKAPHQQHMHHVVLKKGVIHTGDVLEGAYDQQKRQLTRANHSSLHLLLAALKEILGDHVSQAGSYCGPDYGRFDFTHFQKPTEEELHQIEKRVNELILEDLPVQTQVMPLEEARKTNAIAIFDEKYGETVRVVTIGDSEYSTEFCGGTHVANTGDIGLFKIVSEESIGSGIRRITSKTRMAAYTDFKQEEDYLNECAAMYRLQNFNELKDKIAQQQKEMNDLRKDAAAARQELLTAQADAQLAGQKEVNGMHVLFVRQDDVDPGSLKKYAELLRDRMQNGLVFVTSSNNGKVTFVCAASKEAIAKGLKAGDLVKAAAQLTGGNGGGRPDMAQAGGRDVTKIAEALQLIRDRINKAS